MGLIKNIINWGCLSKVVILKFFDALAQLRCVREVGVIKLNINMNRILAEKILNKNVYYCSRNK